MEIAQFNIVMVNVFPFPRPGLEVCATLKSRWRARPFEKGGGGVPPGPAVGEIRICHPRQVRAQFFAIHRRPGNFSIQIRRG